MKLDELKAAPVDYRTPERLCMKCRYDLSGLPLELPCPECGLISPPPAPGGRTPRSQRYRRASLGAFASVFIFPPAALGLGLYAAIGAWRLRRLRHGRAYEAERRELSWILAVSLLALGNFIIVTAALGFVFYELIYFVLFGDRA